MNDQLRHLIEDRNRYKLDIRFVYGKSDLHPDEMKWLGSLESVRTSYLANLHAKCYLNEKEALITSMNLYDFSQVNNQEMGILVRAEDDLDLYQSVRKGAEELYRMSKRVRLDAEIVPEEEEKAPLKRASKSTSAKTAKLPTKGHCIRCNTSISFSMDRPLCDKDYKTWARYEDKEWEEDYCHSCGKERDTSYGKPLCMDCFKKHATALNPGKSVPPWFRKTAKK